MRYRIAWPFACPLPSCTLSLVLHSYGDIVGSTSPEERGGVAKPRAISIETRGKYQGANWVERECRKVSRASVVPVAKDKTHQ